MAQGFRDRIQGHIGAFFSAMADCLVLSWKTAPFYTLLRLLCNLVPPIIILINSLLGKYILDVLAGGLGKGQEHTIFLLLTGTLCLTGILRSLVQKAQTYMQSMHEQIINRELALYMMDRAGNVDIEYFDNAEYYDKLNACTRDAPTIAYLLWNTLSAISSACTMLIAFTVLGRVNLLYCFCILFAAIPSSVASVKYTRTIYTLTLEQINGERKKGYLQGLLLDKRLAPDLRLYNVCDVLKNKYQRLWESMFSQRKAINRRRSILTGVLECLPEIVATGIGLDVAFRVLAGNATIGDYSLYTGLVSQLWSGVYRFSNAVVQIYDNQLKIAQVKSLSQYKNHIADTGTRSLERVETISFEHVTFAYPGTSKNVLEDVTFSVSPQEKVVLVGLNGSGKSTLIKLLLRFYDVDQGAVKINGVDIKEYPLQTVRNNFSVYFQDDPSFLFSLRENITIADIDRLADDTEIKEVLFQSGAEDILDKSSAGLDTYLSRVFDDHGIELSGGQYQKLAIARAFYRRHTALVLDEPSSNLDPKAEHELFEHLKEFTHGKTVLFTSHRLTNVFLADRIVVLEKGKVLEQGTHQELMEVNGRYAELFHYQQEHYQTETKEEALC